MNDITKAKKIPDGQSNFEKIRTENYVYVDKTRFISQIENEDNNFCFLIRPRKFGKSLFLSMLYHYYDICSAHKFDVLFGDLYIGKNPTPKRNAYFVMKFQFSGLDTGSKEKFEISFTAAIQSSIQNFLTEHSSIIDNYVEQKKKIWKIENVRGNIEFAFDIINNFQRKAFIIIDEYDHFANDLIALGTNMSNQQYKEVIWANGVVRDFYETLKDGSQSIVDKIFITGITPMMLDDVTSGFNISNNLSSKEKYNEILGFTEEEVAFVREQAGVDKSLIKVDMEYLYNGYMFHVDGKNRLYNSAMINYFLLMVRDEGEKIKYLIYDNLKIDYGRIRNLLNKRENIEILRKLIDSDAMPAEVVNRFSIDDIHETKNFLSLLYYMGLVTIDNTNPLHAGLKIPNYSVKTMYWDFIERILSKELEGLSLDNSKYLMPVYRLAYENNYEPFFEYFSKYIVHYLSNRDLQHTVEKDIKFLLLPIFFTSNYYLPISELENSEGYTDMYLKRSHLHPKSVSEWIFEIKYIKQCDSDNEKLIEAVKSDAIEQLQRYKTSNFFKDRDDVRFLAVVFAGKKGYYIEEVP